MTRVEESSEQSADRQGGDIAGVRRPVQDSLVPFGTAVRGDWWRTAGAGAMALILGLGLLWVVSLLAKTLAVIAFGITLAAALAPIANWLDHWLPRALAVVLVYLAVLLALAGVGFILIPPLVDQVQQATTRIPDLVRIVQQWLANRNIEIGANLVSTLSSQLGNVSSALVSLPIAIFSSLFDIVVMFFISVYWLIEAPVIHKFLLSLFPGGRRERMDYVVCRMGREMGGFIRGAVLDGLIIGVSTYIGLAILGVNYALALGMIAGLLEFVPWVGPIIAAVPLVGSALLQSPTKALEALAFVLVLHQFEGNIVLPNVMYTQTAISPLLVLIALLTGGAVGGILGALVAIPLAAALQVFVREVIAPEVRRRTGAPAPTDGGQKAEAA
jgi:predicted PurR-regulated permease PerM